MTEPSADRSYGYTLFKQGVEVFLIAFDNVDSPKRKVAANSFIAAANYFPRECDVYRLLSACVPSAEISSAENTEFISRMFNTRDTFGQLMLEGLDQTDYAWSGTTIGACLRDPNFHDFDREYIAYIPQAKFALPSFNLAVQICSVEDITLAFVSLYLNSPSLAPEHFGTLRQYLDSVPDDNSIKPAILALLYRKSQRWADVIHTIESSKPPKIRTQMGENTADIDDTLNKVRFLLRGEALAHLGDFDAAMRNLQEASESDFAQIAAYAFHLIGRIELNKRNQDKAREAFGEKNARLSVRKFQELGLPTSEDAITVTSEAMIDARTSYWDVSTEPKLAEAQKLKNLENRKKYLADAQKELDEQIGMSDVKEQVAAIRAAKEYDLMMIERGLSTGQVEGNARSGDHLILTGPPGTGKTTIARIIALIYAGLGLIDTPKIIEGSRAEMVGEHEGESAVKTKKLCERAMGGILFIDEAYTLQQKRQGGTDPFGGEALDTLMKIMEDERGRFIVIFAGYDDKIAELMKYNPGLPSRFSKKITFTPYECEDLWRIMDLFAEKKSRILDPRVKDFMVNQEGFLLAENSDGELHINVLANARFSREVLDRAINDIPARRGKLLAAQGKSIQDLTDEETMSVTLNDIQTSYVGIIKEKLGADLSHLVTVT